MYRREFLSQSLAAASTSTFFSQTRSVRRQTASLTEQDVEDIISVLDDIRTNTVESELSLDQATKTVCSSYDDFRSTIREKIDAANSTKAAARYVARTTTDFLKLLRDHGIAIAPLESYVGVSLGNGLMDWLTQQLDTVLSKVDEAVKTGTQLLPVVGSLLGMVEYGCQYDNSQESETPEDSEEEFEDFVICTGTLIVEIALLAFGIPYKISFRSTRYIANRLLVRFRGLLGFDAYSVLLKTVYWLINGTVEESVNLIAEEIDEAEQQLESVDVDYSESEFIEVEGFDQSDLEILQSNVSDAGFRDDENSKNGLIDKDDSGPVSVQVTEDGLIPEIDVSLQWPWGDGEDNIPYIPG